VIKLVHLTQEASRTGEYPRLNTRAAKNVLLALAEWFEQRGNFDAARDIRDAL
jgi:hypothetical protein